MKTKSRTKKIIVRAAISILVIVLLALIVIPFCIIHFVATGHVDYGVDENHPLQKIYDSNYFSLDTTELELITEDNYKIWSSEVYTENPKAIIIYLTGIRQPSITYYYGHSKWMKEHGYASFLLEVRGHGNSDGDKVCLGYEEVKDVQALVKYIKAQDKYENVPIVIQGVSMGGAIAINSFGMTPEIDVLIAASAYSSFEDTVYDIMRNYHIPKFICDIEKPLVKLALRLSFGDKVNTIKPIEQVKNIGERPALFIASTGDPEVPHENMYRLLKNAPEHCEYWLRDSDDVGHFIMLNHEFENVSLDTEYCDKLLDFLERAIAD